MPAFFLALAPNAERATGGFVRRVMRMALPAGAITAAATFSTYLIVLATAAPTADESRTAAVVTLFLAALWVLAIVCRPYTPWKVVMLVVVAACMVYDLLTTGLGGSSRWTRAIRPR